VRKILFASAMVLLATPTWAQYTQICTQMAGVLVCTYQPAITHRYNPEAERALRAERDYYNDAYRYELERLTRENNRR